MAAPTAADRNRYTLSVQPINFSLTDGTSIPAPLESPPRSPGGSSLGRAPTPGGGPLSSHPTTPEDVMPGAFPPTPEPEKDGRLERADTRQDSFRTPIYPASAMNFPTGSSSSPEQQQRRPSGVRKLLSFNSLRSSFNSSRTSLQLPRESVSQGGPPQSSPAQHNSLKRPSSPSIISTTASAASRPPLREKKSGSWFRRKSGLFMLNSETNQLDSVEESTRPDTRDSKRLRSAGSTASNVSPAPLLPELGPKLDGGDLGWDEKVFGSS